MPGEVPALAPTLTERSRRVWAATEARAVGRGGIALVARATGISTSTIARGLTELRARVRVPPGRVRRAGGGRKRTIDKDPTLLRDLEGLVEPSASGDPDIPAALDREERAAPGAHAADDGPSRQPPTGGGALEGGRVQLASEPQDARRAAAPRPRRPVPPHHCAGAPLPGRGPAGDLRGHEEEGVGGRFQECRAGVAPDGSARGRAGARLPDPRPGQGRALRGLRSHPQRGLGERRDRPRHRQLCRADDRPVVGRRWDARATGAPARCSSRPMPGAATGPGSGSGSGSCSSWPIARA